MSYERERELLETIDEMKKEIADKNCQIEELRATVTALLQPSFSEVLADYTRQKMAP
jgi:hypothetical protein